MMPPLLARFRREWPGVRLALNQMTTAAQLEALYDGRLDIGFTTRFMSSIANKLGGKPARLLLSSTARA
jgi:DNA-binding transcriptional LysR family regulator